MYSDAVPGAEMKRLLLVDDSRAIRSFLESRLQGHFELTLAENGARALELVRRSPFDLVLSDINMPELNGIELFQHAKRVRPALPIVLMTDANIDHYLADARHNSIRHILAKACFRLDFDGTLRSLKNLISPRTSGMERHLGPGGEVRTFIAGSLEDVPQILEQCDRLLKRFPRHQTYMRLLPELVRNAFQHGFSSDDAEIPHEETLVTVSVGADWQRVGVGVRDSGGKLTHQRVVQWFEQQLEQQVALGDEGQGLMIARWLMDQCYITIDPNLLCEVVCFDLLHGYVGHRSLHVDVLEHLGDERTSPTPPPSARALLTEGGGPGGVRTGSAGV